ncbi:Cytidine deaminase [Enhygromyxa salina]|uniref:Cytidine deaminase n=1 Tax=Enhygromyxa salina TaxID=215803 RepID=A0A0C1ZJI7_9BACT|nr:cytidine deaminase [Enhygromyxa salina]KIG17644.1 Cytidine deaminase [Enhygromyxa salina]
MSNHPGLPRTPIVEHLDARLIGPGSAAVIEASELAALQTETGLDKHALILASLEWARRWARAPLSSFEVGAAALGESGRLYLGANIEFHGFPLSQTIHAEQSAIAHAWAHAETGLTVIATSAAPCGFCRQFMFELPEPRPQLLLADAPGGRPMSIESLLPSAFGPTQLGRSPQLLRAGPHGLQLIPHAQNAEHAEHAELTQLALAAANRSSAPYTGACAGVALETADGQRFAGAVAESVAYNPTLAPMQAALIAAHHGGQGVTLSSITHAVLVELEGATVSQLDFARQLLASVAPTASCSVALARA